jgi:hypothetical protein
VHRIEVASQKDVSYTGGRLFLNCFPTVRKDPDGTAIRHWMYVPDRIAGEVQITSTVRIRMFDEEGQRDIMPDGADPANLGPGMVAVDNTNTRGEFSAFNINPYMGCRGDEMLMARPFAEEAHSSCVRIRQRV